MHRVDGRLINTTTEAKPPAAAPARARLAIAAVRPVVIVGAGPAGVHVARQLLLNEPGLPLVMYSDEPFPPYQRAHLTAFMGGKLDLGAIDNQLALPDGHRFVQHYKCRVTAIDRIHQCVRDTADNVQPYARLILATGSRARIPHIPGIDLTGVYALRNLENTHELTRHCRLSVRTVVLGGGLLGVETACALQRYCREIVLVHDATHLLNNQLDGRAARILQTHLEKTGVRVLLHDSVGEVLGDATVAGVRLVSGETIACETFVVAAGTSPNVDIAAAAGLSVNGGIRVDNYMRTSDPCIYAIGECAEHDNRLSNLLAPCIEQANVAADHLCGGDRRYVAGTPAASLKVVECPVFSMGDFRQDGRRGGELTYCAATSGVYRKLVLRDGVLIGAMAVGDWAELPQLQEAITQRTRPSARQLTEFRHNGRLFSEPIPKVARAASNAVVCRCGGVFYDEVRAAIREGCHTVEALSARTSAGRACGSCRPLLAQLLGRGQRTASRTGRSWLLGAAAATLVLVVLLFSPYVWPPSNSVRDGWSFDILWRNGTWRQLSGYSLVGVSLAGLGISLRKRSARVSFGDFASWRTAHALLGALALVLLGVHTGLRLGNNFNAWLAIGFGTLTLLGALTAVVAGLERAAALGSGAVYRMSLLLHVLLLWPLPALLGVHILCVYYF